MIGSMNELRGLCGLHRGLAVRTVAALLTFGLLASCSHDESSPTETAAIEAPSTEAPSADGDLIVAIASAVDKFDIQLTDLPADGRRTLERDYYDHVPTRATVAPTLGYEISIEGGREAQVYFDLRGRKLERGDRTRRCYELVYPVEYILPDGTIVAVTNRDREAYARIRAWFEAHPDVRPQLTPEFPIEVILGTRTKVISSMDEWRRLLAFCRNNNGDSDDPEGEDDSGDDDQDHDDPDQDGDGSGDSDTPRPCFTLVYPVEYSMPDGTVLTATEKSREGYAEIKAWYADHPDVRERPSLQYPVEIVWSGRDVRVIEDLEMMRRAKARCRDLEENGRGL